MRIVFIGAKGIPTSAISGAGGVEMHVEQIATRLADRGHQVSVYIRGHADLEKHRLTYKGVRLIRIWALQSKNFETITHVFLSTLHALFRPADIIHYHGVGPSSLAWIPRLLKWRSKVVCTFHSRDWYDTKWGTGAKLYLRYGEWAALHYPHATVVISHVLQVFCRDHFHRKTIYIPNGADIPGPQGIDRVHSLGLEPGNYLLGVGRLVPNKAYEVAINAYKHVKSDMPLVIAGASFHSDEYVEKLEKLAAEDPRIRLVGFQSGENLRQLYAHCYAFVHPSRAEGLSTSIIEAMAAAKVVIMSDIKENLELIDHSGISFKTDDEKALAETLRLVLEDPTMAKERGERAREVVRKGYSWDSVVDRLVKLYNDLRA
jgi:glycosyltransferase involved in cell wall biosynthesis